MAIRCSTCCWPLMGGKLRASNPADCLTTFRAAAVTAAFKAAASKSRLPAKRDFKSRPPTALPKLWISSPGGVPAFEAGLPDGFQGRCYRQITGYNSDRLPQSPGKCDFKSLARAHGRYRKLRISSPVGASKFRVCRCHGGFPSRCSCKVSKSAGQPGFQVRWALPAFWVGATRRLSRPPASAGEEDPGFRPGGWSAAF